MKKTKAAWWFATWLGCGYFPFAPGTVGSLAALIIAWLLVRLGFTNVHFVVLSLALLYPAVYAAGVVAEESGRKDPGFVVVDEVLGQWFTLAGAARYDWKTFVLGFFLFRLFDIWKPPPIRLIERISGGAGIIFDDMLAGAYAALVLFMTGWFN